MVLLVKVLIFWVIFFEFVTKSTTLVQRVPDAIFLLFIGQIETWSQSYNFLIYSYNASIEVG
jgi:hypothetical protein